MGIGERILSPFNVEKVNTAPPQRMSGAIIGALLGYMIVIAMITGGMYPGIDLTAGEKERKTMELLLSSSATREEIVLGKILAVITATFVTSALAIISSLIIAIATQAKSYKEAQSYLTPLIIIAIFPAMASNLTP